MSEGEVHDAEKIRKKHPESGGFQVGGDTTRRLREQFADDDPGWSPGREGKPEVKPEWLERSSGYFVGDPNRVPADSWEGAEVTKVSDIQQGLAAAIEKHANVKALLLAASKELQDALEPLWNLIQGTEDQSIRDVCAIGYQNVEDITARAGDMDQSINRIHDYMNKL